MKKGVLLSFVLSAGLLAQAAAGRELFRFAPGPEKAGETLPSSAAVEHRAIEIDLGLLAAEDAGLIELPLLDGVLYEAERTEAVVRGPGDSTWRGKLRLPDGEDGTVTLTVRGGAMSGLIYAPSGVYEIVPGALGGHKLTRLDQGLFPPCGGEITPEEHAGAHAASDTAGAAIAADSENQIDVLVLYTPQARTAAGGTAAIQAIAQSAVDASNTAYANSGITTRLRMVHTGEAGDETGLSFVDNLYWLAGDPDVAQLRDTHGADLVSLLINTGGACGVAFIMSSPSPTFAPSGFSVVNHTCAVGNLSFAHELGHNMGSAHNPEQAGGTPSYSYGYGHWVNGSFRTVMSYADPCPSGCTRRAYFSNPNVSYNGQPTGIANQRDNARSINNTDSVVANFRQAADAPTFADVPVTHWAWPFIEAIYDAGITSGCATDPRRYCPDGLVSRDQMAVFLEIAKRGNAFVPPPALGIFSDVSLVSPYAPWIEQLYDDGVTGGCATVPLRYCPTGIVTRGQMAVFLLAAKHGQGYTPPPATGIFSDVAVTSPFAPWIEQLYDEGVTGGCGTNPLRYCPGTNVTRAQMAVFLAGAFSLPLPPVP
jgi:hypothetical protein